MERIGVIGLGRMGSAIAARFSAMDYPVTGWTRSGLTEARAVDLGIARADDLTTLCGAADILILSLFDDAAVAEMLDRLAARDLKGKLIVETSTVSPSVLKARAPDLAAAGAAAVDAPISGGPELVARGACGLFVGGTDADAARFLSVAPAISDKAVHVGPLGAGMAMKTVNNGMLQGYFATLSEMMRIARRAGLPLETALRILAAGPAATPMLTARLPKMLGEDDSVGFPIAGVAKDAEVFLRIAEEAGVEAATLRVAQAGWAEAIAAGLSDHDLAARIPQSYDSA